jgi:hypothetical protein
MRAVVIVSILIEAVQGGWPWAAETSTFGPFLVYETLRARLTLRRAGEAGPHVSEHSMFEEGTALLRAAAGSNQWAVQHELEAVLARQTAESGQFHGALLASSAELVAMA